MSLFESVPMDRLKSNDRILVLKAKEGSKGPLSTSGLIDKRLFTGENRLHAIRSDIDGLWRMSYDQGGVPSPLKESFTTFNKLKDHAIKYFASRNVEITEVIE